MQGATREQAGGPVTEEVSPRLVLARPKGGTAGEPAQLAAAYRSALEEAAAVGARSIAFPAISTGIYGYPIEPATRIALRAGLDAPEGIDEVRYVCFDAPTADLYRRELAALGG